MIRHFTALIVVVILIYAAPPVWAQNADALRGVPQQEICNIVKKYEPSADVEHHSSSGTDMRGVKFPVEVPLEMDLQKSKFSSYLPQEIATESVIGTLKIYQDGLLEFNGQDIGYDIDKFCRQDFMGTRSTATITRGNSDDILKSQKKNTEIQKPLPDVPAKKPAAPPAKTEPPAPQAQPDKPEPKTPQPDLPVDLPVDLPAEMPQKEPHNTGEILEGSAN